VQTIDIVGMGYMGSPWCTPWRRCRPRVISQVSTVRQASGSRSCHPFNYLLTRRPDEARRILKEITEKAPDSLPAWRLLAQLDFVRGKVDEALKSVESVLKKSPSDIEHKKATGEHRPVASC
jgi:predicted Zn-dependent protease